MRLSFRPYVCLLVLPIALQAVTPTPILSSSSPAVAAGQSVTLTSSVPVTWSLNGQGTLTNQTPTSVVYTAPPSVPNQSSILGCPATPNDSVFNTKVDNLPVHPDSQTWLSHMSSVPLSIAPSWGVTYADDSTPTSNWKPYYGNYNGNFSKTYNFPFPGRGPSLKRENGNYVGVTGYVSSNDHHTVIVRRSDCQFFETYNDRINGETFACADGATSGCNVSSINLPYGFGVASDNNGPYAMPYGSTDAAGLPLAPLSWHLDEVKSGVIKHAVRFTASVGYINGYTWPATTANASSPFAPPYGARFLLKPKSKGGPDPVAACTPSGGPVNADCVTMLTALQQYGMMLADIGLNNQIETFTDLTEDATTRAALKLITDSGIGIYDFYAVDESNLRQTASNNYQTYANGSYSVDPDNGYVQPVSSAIITATPGSGNPTKMPLALQGAAVGLNSNELTIAAGLVGYQLTGWVNPSTLNQSVTWSLVSGVGSVTPAGFYTPPASTAGGVSAVLKVFSAADSNAVNYVYVKVLSTDAGTIRIDSASETNTTDGYGHVWNSESGVEASLPTQSEPDYPLWPGPEGNQYGTVLYTRGGDIAYSLVVPNGNYKIRVMYGQIFNGNVAHSPYAESFTSSPALVEAQGAIAAHNYDWNVASGFKYQTPADAYVPARVTDNSLQIRAMVSTPDSAITAASGIGPLYPGLFPYFVTPVSQKSSGINGIEIIPDSTTPHWVIDTQGVNAIAVGQAIQLYNIDWYTGANDPAWSIVSGPAGASITADGLVSLASDSDPAGVPVVVMASDGEHSATVTFTTPRTPTSGPKLPTAPTPPPAPHVTSAYAYVRSLTLSHAEVSNADQSDFPVVISVTDSSLADKAHGGHVDNTNGYDIVLASDAAGVNLLNWEVERYDPSTGQWIAHVRVPSVSHTADTNIYLLYGNANIRSSLASPASVWDSQYQGVYHFASATDLLKDSTSNSRDGSILNLGFTENGEIAGATNAQGASGTLPDISMLNSQSGTIELWINSSTPQDTSHNATLMQQDWFDGSSDGFYMGWSGYFNDFEVDWKSAGNFSNLSASAQQMNILPNTWNQIVYSWSRDLNTQTLYLNGAPVVSSTQAFSNPTFTTPFSFSVAYNPLYYGLNGLIDEARFSSSQRSADWIETEFQNQKPASNFVTVGAEQKTN